MKRISILFMMLTIFILNSCSMDVENIESSYFHISLDDVDLSVGNLSSEKYASIWEEPLFDELISLHNKYGAVFSLYVFEESFSRINSKYKRELYDSANWLKFGLHSINSSSTFNSSSTYKDGQESWNLFANDVVMIVGTEQAIDRVPRLHYYSGSKDCLNGMKDATYGALGFLSADDDRNSYYLSTIENNYLQKNDFVYDKQEQLVFLKTDMRGDWFCNDFTSQNHYDKPKSATVYNELRRRFSSSNYEKQIPSYIWFCHEWKVYDGTSLNENIVWLEDACKFAFEHDIEFDFPQNRINEYTEPT